MNLLAFLCYMRLMSDTCNIWACPYKVHKGLFQAKLWRKGQQKIYLEQKLARGREQEVLSLEIKAMWHKVISNMASF